MSASSEGCSLSVSDDGQGVPEDVVARIFEPFARGGNTAGTQGSGLGLAICRRLVDAFGGSITYEHADPRGARFLVSLRRA